MKTNLRHPEKSIAAKLIIAIGLLMLIVSFIFWYAIRLKQKKDILSLAQNYAVSFAAFTTRSTRTSMLHLQQAEIQHTLCWSKIEQDHYIPIHLVDL